MSEVGPHGIGLSREAFDQAFPFHFVVDGGLRILQVGPALARIFPDVAVGSAADAGLVLRRPRRAFEIGTIGAHLDCPFVLEHPASGIRLRGQFLAVCRGAWAFIGSPWFETADAIEAAGISLADYPVHDPVAELLMIGQTQRMAVADLKELTTRLEQQREEIKRTERIYREAIASVNAVAYRESSDEDRYDYIDEGIRELTGYGAEEISPTLFRGLIAETRSVQQVPEENPTQRIRRRAEHRILDRNGRERWVSEASVPVIGEGGLPIGVVGILQDVTDRVRYEAELQRISSELDTILRLSPDGFAAFDHAGRLTYCNPSFERIMALPPGGLVGRDLLALDELFRRQSPGTIHAALRALSDDQWEDVEVTWPERRSLARHVRRIPGPDGRPRGLVLIVRDVTREREVERLKSEFLSTAAHELRTPMTSVLGFAELLLSSDFEPEVTRDVAETIYRQSSLLVKTVNELLDLARIEARRGADFELEEVSLTDLVSGVVARLRIPDDDRRAVLAESPPLSPRVRVDAAKISLALNNVLANAFKYSPQGGPITVAVQRRSREGGWQAGVIVSDRGIGMSREQVARIFERFYRADPSGSIPGTGLGMALVKEIVELHGGQVEVESVPGEGTTIALWLPVRGEERMN